MKKLIAVLSASLIFVVPVADAASTAGTLSVTANVATTCTVNSPTLAFGTYTGAVDDVQTDIVVTCGTIGVVGSVSIDGTVGARQMVSGANVLGYEIYTDSARTNAWGSAATPSMPLDSTLAVNTITVYGQIPAGTVPAPGGYLDTRNITVNY